MERIREDLLRRAHMERRNDLEHGRLSTDEEQIAEPRESGRGMFSSLAHTTLPRPFTVGQINSNSNGNNNDNAAETLPGVNGVEGPKSPVTNHRTSVFGRFRMPNLSRMWARPADGSQSHQMEGDPRPTSSTFQSRGIANANMPVPPAPVEPAASSDNLARGGLQSEIESSPQFESNDNRRNRRRHRSARHGRHRRRKDEPRKFLFCFPWIKSKHIRSQVLRCFVSGLFLVILLAVYLALSMTNRIQMGEFTIALVLVVLLATTLFCYGIIRLCMLVVRGDRARAARNRGHLGPEGGGYAVPSQPIQVVLASDQEATGADGEAPKVTPPAYGAWRESVRVDPNRFFWQRNESVPSEEPSEVMESRSGPRPPSYVSDDGVSYVVNAAPRSTVPSSDPELPPHPSEIGRIYETRW